MSAFDYFAIRNDGAPDGLIRQAGPVFEYLDSSGDWHERPALIDKIREWNVDEVDRAEAQLIAARRGGEL